MIEKLEDATFESIGKMPYSSWTELEMSSLYAEAKRARKSEQELEDLLKHCWIHEGYSRCGYNQMTTEQKELFDALTSRELE